MKSFCILLKPLDKLKEEDRIIKLDKEEKWLMEKLPSVGMTANKMATLHLKEVFWTSWYRGNKYVDELSRYMTTLPVVIFEVRMKNGERILRDNILEVREKIIGPTVVAEKAPKGTFRNIFGEPGDIMRNNIHCPDSAINASLEYEMITKYAQDYIIA